MNQNQQPRSPSDYREEPIKYGDLFPVQGDLAGEPIRPRCAGLLALMQTAETLLTGKTHKGGAASVMQSAATINELSGHVAHGDFTADPAVQGVTVTETEIPGGSCIVSERVAGQTIVRFAVPKSDQTDEEKITIETVVGTEDNEKITIGEALEAAALSQGDKPVEQSDAAAIQAAEVRAIKMTAPHGVAAAAQSAAEINSKIAREEDKITVGDVLHNATEKLGTDKEVTREDAEKVVGAEMRNRDDLSTVAGGVADSITAAARLNEKTNGA
ncbi:late embryogenesis abundant protein 31-like [Phalaenopsis equestris]|uniref:late embryogenesis abundant protein 31-like n=1 Tax=Phalaenopsis equestris TaxID=78828 RepID=UPI0009E4E1E6|nr:late embryogenesis abundant protein 31-like [Phalaenopsis equestris]